MALRERRKESVVDSFTRSERGEAICGRLHGELPTKSNQRRIFNGIPIKSQKALDFVERVKFVASYSRFGEPLLGATSAKDYRRGGRFLYLKVQVFGDSLQRDLDCELLCDALQDAGVINNDRAIRRKFYWWELDAENPRVEFEIGYIDRPTVGQVSR